MLQVLPNIMSGQMTTPTKSGTTSRKRAAPPVCETPPPAQAPQTPSTIPREDQPHEEQEEQNPLSKARTLIRTVETTNQKDPGCMPTGAILHAPYL